MILLVTQVCKDLVFGYADVHYGNHEHHEPKHHHEPHYPPPHYEPDPYHHDYDYSYEVISSILKTFLCSALLYICKNIISL